MTKIAQQLAAARNGSASAEEIIKKAEAMAIAKDEIWTGDGYTKYTFDDNSVLVLSGPVAYGIDADDAESIRGYGEWLDADARAKESEEIDRLIEALES